MKLSSLGTSWRILSQYKLELCMYNCLWTAICLSSLLWNQQPPKCCFSGPNNWLVNRCDTSTWQCHPMQNTLFASITAVVALGTSWPCDLESSLCYVRLVLPHYYSFGLLKQDLEGCWFHSNKDVQLAIIELLQMQKPSFWCNRILILVPGWERDVNMLWDYFEK
jgi:hypothetical protein